MEQYIVIRQFVDNALQKYPQLFCVDVQVYPHKHIVIYIDGDHGVTIENCAQLNKAWYEQIELLQIFNPNQFSLEVSSPGADKPLKIYRQYMKHIGRIVHIQLKDEWGNKKNISGKLLKVTQDHIDIEQVEGRGKKQLTQVISIPFNVMVETKVDISFIHSLN